MYAVWYREAPHRDWRRLPDDLYERYSLAKPVADAVQAALRHIGYPFAQAEARKLTNADDPRIQPTEPAPPVEVGYGETPPDGYGEVTTLTACISCGRGYARGGIHFHADGSGPVCAECFAAKSARRY